MDGARGGSEICSGKAPWLYGSNTAGKGKHEENIFEATGRQMEVEERKTRRRQKTTVPLLASLELFNASSTVIFLLEQDPIELEMEASKCLGESFQLQYTSEMFLCNSAELACEVSRELNPLSL